MIDGKTKFGYENHRFSALLIAQNEKRRFGSLAAYRSYCVIIYGFYFGQWIFVGYICLCNVCAVFCLCAAGACLMRILSFLHEHRAAKAVMLSVKESEQS